MEELVGYLHPRYAESLAEYGTPCELPRSQGWILERDIAGFPYRDAMGCYPLFSCQDWSQLEADVRSLEDEIVSLALVTDPFGDYTEDDLRRSFPDVCIPFKQHYVLDLHRPFDETLSKSTRKSARRATRNVEVEVCTGPEDFLEDWLALYTNLTTRHGIKGMHTFSRTAFARQLATPGATVFKASSGGELVGAQICYVQGDVVQCHLSAFSELGYTLGASHAVEWFSINYFADKARWYNLGGGAGTINDGTDGLNTYKRSWSSETRTAYFCGRIFDRDKYDEIVRAKQIGPTGYFPAYRQGEFT